MITITVDKKEFERANEKLRSLSLMARDSIMRKSFTDLTIETRGQLIRNLMGKILHPRSHGLVGSVGSRVYQDGNYLIGIIGSGAQRGGPGRMSYANIHETGGVITAKRSKYLAIPLPAALTPAGVLKKKPRDWPNTFVAKSSAGNLVIFQRKLSKGAIALFVLKGSVTIPARRYMSRTAEEIAPRVMEIMTRSVERELAKI